MNRADSGRRAGDSRDVDAASAVKIWMDDCIKHLDRLTLQEFSDAQEFWQMFPDVAESILRRGYARSSVLAHR